MGTILIVRENGDCLMMTMLTIQLNVWMKSDNGFKDCRGRGALEKDAGWIPRHRREVF